MIVTNYDIRCNIGMPCRFAVVADLHNMDCDEVLHSLGDEKIDFILVPGDLFHGELENSQESKRFIKNAVKICPVFLSIGNHECFFSKEDFEEIKKLGAVVLDNSYCKYRNIIIGGLSSGFGTRKQGHFKRTPAPKAKFLDEFSSKDEYKILMSHHPEYYKDYIKDKNIDLTVCGHAHGGQFRFFGKGLFAPGQMLFPKYTSGVWDNKLIISRGLANTAFVPRIFNKPELVYVNLLPV